MIRLSTYLRQFKYVVLVRGESEDVAWMGYRVLTIAKNRVGDIVDIKANGAVQKG